MNEEITTDGRYGERLAAVHENDSWQRHPSQTWRRKRHDGSNLLRQREGEGKKEREEGFGGGGGGVVDNMAFVSGFRC